MDAEESGKRERAKREITYNRGHNSQNPKPESGSKWNKKHLEWLGVRLYREEPHRRKPDPQNENEALLFSAFENHLHEDWAKTKANCRDVNRQGIGQFFYWLARIGNPEL